jgi:hypothetical protein
MMKLSASSALRTRRAQAAVLLLLASCSFQKFDYLENGATSAAGAGGGSAAGSGNQSGSDDNGGTEQTEAGGGGGSPGKGGSGGSPVASAGEDSGGEAGAPGAAGDGGGGTDVGGSAAGGTNGGGMGGTGGMAGTGNTGATGEIVNPSFETGTTVGWTVEPADALSKRHAFVQYPPGASSVPDGTYEFSTWHMTDVYTVTLYQTITGLEDGTYTFKGYFSRGAQNAAVLFARNCGGTDPDPVDIPITAGTEWVAVSVTGIEVSGGSCEVGLGLDSQQENWLNADLFSFEKETE